MAKVIPYNELKIAELIVDAIYEGGAVGNANDDPIARLLPGVGNQGGFRAAGRGADKQLVVLYSSGDDKDWPDQLDLNTGQYTYYGDNKTPGHELHDTQRGGNRILRRVFELLHGSPSDRKLIPPFFVFRKLVTGNSTRSVQFKGLAVPGFFGASATEDLVAVWKSTGGQRFQNYRALFTILDSQVVPRSWIKTLATGEACDTNAPKVWLDWVKSGKYMPLTAEPTTVIRTIEQQTPDTALKNEILEKVWSHFKNSPIKFEAFAARLYQMTDQRVVIDEITRASVDGGRDAVGHYLLGLNDDPVYAEFSLEAKCYKPPINSEASNSVGVKEVSRLISRIRHREFGVLVTTSVIARQAYEEVRGDRHPIIFICGRDIAEILIKNGINTSKQVVDFLCDQFKV
ncbi:MAG: hypothetical protein JW384_03504 [Nitrosomonadaceae bacterium]|nr:hypothetical protein [Nitrosomonadaceae bacterium]